MTTQDAPKILPLTKLALSYRETCAYVGLSRRTIEKLVAIGEFPKPRPIPHTTSLRFDAAAIRRWWENQDPNKADEECQSES